MPTMTAKLYKLIYMGNRQSKSKTLEKAKSTMIDNGDDDTVVVRSNVDFVRYSVVDKLNEQIILNSERDLFQSLFKMSFHHAFASSLIDLSTNVGLVGLGMAKANAIRTAAETALSATGALFSSAMIESIHAGFHIHEVGKAVNSGNLPERVYDVIVAEEAVRVLNAIAGTTIGVVCGEIILPFAGIGAALGGGLGSLTGCMTGLVAAKMTGQLIEFGQDIRTIQNKNLSSNNSSRNTLIVFEGLVEKTEPISNSNFYIEFNKSTNSIHTITSL